MFSYTSQIKIIVNTNDSFRQSHGADNAPTQKKSLEDTLSSSSTENTVKNNLTSFDELDKEFYDIMKSKLKIDLKEKDLKEVDAEENKNDSVTDLARRENVEELVAEEGVNRGIAYRAEVWILFIFFFCRCFNINATTTGLFYPFC